MFEVCPSSGKISYVTPHEGYLNMQGHGKKSKSGRVSRSHYKCGDCRMFHIVTVNKTPRKPSR